MFILCNLCLNHALAFALRSCERFLVIWPKRCRLVKTGYRIVETYLGEGEGPVFTDFTEVVNQYLSESCLVLLWERLRLVILSD